ncbi:hypothetical protein D3C84_1243860 [compost metagenome]
MLRENRPGPLDGLVDNELFERNRLAPLVAMEEVALLRGQAAGPGGLPEKIDDIALAPELPVADRVEPGRLL